MIIDVKNYQIIIKRNMDIVKRKKLENLLIFQLDIQKIQIQFIYLQLIKIKIQECLKWLGNKLLIWKVKELMNWLELKRKERIELIKERLRKNIQKYMYFEKYNLLEKMEDIYRIIFQS